MIWLLLCLSILGVSLWISCSGVQQLSIMVCLMLCQCFSDLVSGCWIDWLVLLIRMLILLMCFLMFLISVLIVFMFERLQGSDIVVLLLLVIWFVIVFSRFLWCVMVIMMVWCSLNCLVVVVLMFDDVLVSRMCLLVRLMGCIVGWLISSCGEIGGCMLVNVICLVNQCSGFLFIVGEFSFVEFVVIVVFYLLGFCLVIIVLVNGCVRNSVEMGFSWGDVFVGRCCGF